MSEPYTLILFTDSYPYSGSHEQTFLEPEIPALVRNFKQVILVPQKIHGHLLAIPENVRVESGLAKELENLPSIIKASLNWFIPSQFLSDMKFRGFRILHPYALYRFWVFAIKAQVTENWLARFLAEGEINSSTTICYTFWLSFVTMGIGSLKKRLPAIRLVSRAHSADLYEQRYTPPYLPCRQNLLSEVDALLPDSLEGERYISGLYPWFATRCQAARQGVNDPGFLTKYSLDGIFRVVSCSFLVNRKRVDLILKGLALLAANRPELKFEWHHIGDGELRAGLMAIAIKLLPKNLVFTLHGYLLPTAMIAFYANNPIDLFVNSSSNEGTPVSLMEAASCGIPIVATAVGGNTEIVSTENGLLVGSDPSPEEIASAIMWFVDNPDLAQTKRINSRRIWAENYDSAVNFQKFSDKLKVIRATEINL